MRPCLAKWLVLALFALALPATAAPLGYASGYNALYRIDLANGQATRIGDLGFNDVEGLAISPGGVLYGVADATMMVAGRPSATTDFLFRVDTGTGAGTLVGQLPGLQGLGNGGNLDFGLAFTCDGRLWLSGETTGDLWEVTPTSGAIRPVGNSGASLSGLAARGNRLYGVSVDPTPRLYEIDPASAEARVIGPLSVGGRVLNVGLEFDETGQLWATLDPSDLSASRVARIDLETGRGTVIASINPDIGMKALAIAAPGGCSGGGNVGGTPLPVTVPGPGWPLLVLLGALAALLAGRRLR